MEFSAFSWLWLLFILVCTAAFLLFADRRGRSSMQSYSDELHRAARELTLRYDQLTSVREAAKESKQESKRRATELKSLRDRITQLTAQVNTLTEERDQTRDTAVELQAKVTDLTTRLARADVRRATLEKELSAATLMRLEVLSQLRTDETQRLTALTRLRQPGGGILAMPVSPVATRRVETRLSPLSVTKSPSESFLSNLQPDLEIDSSDDEVDMRALEATRVELEKRMRRALGGEAAGVLHVSAINLGQAAVSMKGIGEGRKLLAGNEEVGKSGLQGAGEVVVEGKKTECVMENVGERTSAGHTDVEGIHPSGAGEQSGMDPEAAAEAAAEVLQLQGEMNVDGVSEVLSSADVEDGPRIENETAPTRANGTIIASPEVVGKKGDGSGLQDAAVAEPASFQIEEERVIPGAASLDSETGTQLVDPEAKQVHASTPSTDSGAKVKPVKTTVESEDISASSATAGTYAESTQGVDGKVEECVPVTNAGAALDPFQCTDEDPDECATAMAAGTRPESAEPICEKLDECSSESATGARRESVQVVDEKGDSSVSATVTHTQPEPAVAADGNADAYSSMTAAVTGAESAEAVDEQGGEFESPSDAETGRSEIVQTEDENGDGCVSRTAAGTEPEPVATADEDADERAAVTRTGIRPESAKTSDEERAECSERAVCARPESVQAAGEKGDHDASNTPTETEPTPAEAINESADVCASITASMTRPESAQAGDKSGDGFASTLDAQTGPQSVQTADKKGDVCVSTTAADKQPEPVVTADEVADDWASATFASTRAEPAEVINVKWDECALTTVAGALPEVVDAVEETMKEIMSTIAAKTTVEPVTELVQQVDTANAKADGSELHADENKGILGLRAGKGKGMETGGTASFSRSDVPHKSDDEAEITSQNPTNLLSISRTPWLDSLNPSLQKRPTSQSISGVIRPVSPDIPGVFSSAIVRKPDE